MKNKKKKHWTEKELRQLMVKGKQIHYNHTLHRHEPITPLRERDMCSRCQGDCGSAFYVIHGKNVCKECQEER